MSNSKILNLFYLKKREIYFSHYTHPCFPTNVDGIPDGSPSLNGNECTPLGRINVFSILLRSDGSSSWTKQIEYKLVLRFLDQKVFDQWSLRPPVS